MRLGKGNMVLMDGFGAQAQLLSLQLNSTIGAAHDTLFTALAGFENNTPRFRQNPPFLNDGLFPEGGNPVHSVASGGWGDLKIYKQLYSTVSISNIKICEKG
jgi:hypothetical protein